MPKPLPYRPCVGQMVINRAGGVWIGCRVQSRSDSEGTGQWWQMPQGGIEPGEDPAEAARRELIEETGIRTVEQIGELPDWLTYDLPPELVGKAWGGRYRGQKQKWFAYRFLGEDAEVSIIPPPGHKAEFSAWRWAPAADLPSLIVPFKRAVYVEVLKGLGHLARPL